jgi:hypothetical protein
MSRITLRVARKTLNEIGLERMDVCYRNEVIVIPLRIPRSSNTGIPADRLSRCLTAMMLFVIGLPMGPTYICTFALFYNKKCKKSALVQRSTISRCIKKFLVE